MFLNCFFINVLDAIPSPVPVVKKSSPVEAVKDELEATVLEEKKGKEPVAKETEEEYEDFEVTVFILKGILVGGLGG